MVGRLCLAKTKSAGAINRIRRRRMTCCLGDIYLVRSFGEECDASHSSPNLRTGCPDSRKTIFLPQQLQQKLGFPAVGLLLPDSLGLDSCVFDPRMAG